MDAPLPALPSQTVICYLNEAWRPEHGGELRIWPADDTPPVTIEPVMPLAFEESPRKQPRPAVDRGIGGPLRPPRPPGLCLRVDAADAREDAPTFVLAPTVRAQVAGRLVLFISSLEHEVLPAWKRRYALTTWMFNRRDVRSARRGRRALPCFAARGGMAPRERPRDELVR